MTAINASELVGRLTVADAMLGELVTDIRRVLAYANWPGAVHEPHSGDTTGRATEKLERELGHEAALSAAPLLDWMAKAKDVAERRNRVVHAIALDQCMNCGEATMFRHPRSDADVDRSPEAVKAILDEYGHIRERGISVAAALSAAVNGRIYAEAKKLANATDEIQNPPQVYPRHVEHLCMSCSGSGRGHTVVRGGMAIVVVPDARWDEFISGRWPGELG